MERQKTKSILLRTPDVQAILDGRKTSVRRIIKPQSPKAAEMSFICFASHKSCVGKWSDADGKSSRLWTPPCHGDDILYVRETWLRLFGRYKYRADSEYGWLAPGLRWHSPVTMPKEAARLFLRVKQVSVERLQDITEEQAIAEGYEGLECDCANSYVAGGMWCCDDCANTGWREPPQLDFMYDWDKNIQPENLSVYGWYANPWVWVIEFEIMKGMHTLENPIAGLQKAVYTGEKGYKNQMKEG